MMERLPITKDRVKLWINAIRNNEDLSYGGLIILKMIEDYINNLDSDE